MGRMTTEYSQSYSMIILFSGDGIFEVKNANRDIGVPRQDSRQTLSPGLLDEDAAAAVECCNFFLGAERR
jgi:hypothetical protein